MSKTPFMPLWVSDFLGDTLDLDAAEIGAYMLLIMAQWQRDGASLPKDDKKLQRVARCGRSWPKVWATISRYFAVDEAGVYSPKGREVFKNVASKVIVNKHNGALGGAAKALNNKEARLANATDSLERNATILKPYSEVRDKSLTPSKAEPDGFDEFWGVVPRKVAKAEAQKAYAKALRITDAATILNGMKRYAQAREGQDEQYTAHPSTWLNAGRWADETETLKPITGGNYAKPSKSSDRLSAFIAGARGAS